jgi:hypothetical protein
VSADPAYRLAPDFAYDEPQRANLYAYSLNNPMRWIDPDGLDSCAKETDCKVDAPPAPEPEKAKKPQTSGQPTDTTTTPEGRGTFSGPVGDAIKSGSGKESSKDAAAQQGVTKEVESVPSDAKTTPTLPASTTRDASRRGKGSAGTAPRTPSPPRKPTQIDGHKVESTRDSASGISRVNRVRLRLLVVHPGPVPFYDQ